MIKVGGFYLCEFEEEKNNAQRFVYCNDTRVCLRCPGLNNISVYSIQYPSILTFVSKFISHGDLILMIIESRLSVQQRLASRINFMAIYTDYPQAGLLFN